MNFCFYSHLSSVETPNSSHSNSVSAQQNSVDAQWLQNQLEEIKQTDIQNFNLPSNTDISEFVLRQSQTNSPSTIQKEKTNGQFSYIKNEGNKDSNEQQLTPKKQYTSERKKENFRRYNTTSQFIFQEEKSQSEDDGWLKKLKSSQSQKKSAFTKQINWYASNKNEIFVKYFGTHYTKKIFVDEEIKAAEFIVLALKQYQNDPLSDKSKYEYPNFSLAYVLVGQDTSPIKQIYTYNNDDNFEDDSKQQLDEESLEKQEIDYESNVFYKMVELLPATSLISLDFDFLKKTYITHPEYIILLIEDPQLQAFYNIKVHKKGNIGDCQADLNKKSQKRQYYLTLKYNCINYDCSELSEKFPIEQLPIHWLVICSKNPFQSSDSLNKEETSIIVNNQTNQENSQLINSCRFQSQVFMTLATQEKMQLLYSYQEYKLMKYKRGYLNEVTLGIDYFDLYYFYTIQKKEENSITQYFFQLCKQIKNVLYKKKKNNYKRIPVACITDLKQKKEHYFEIQFEFSDGYKKKLQFFSKNEKNDDKIAIKEAFTKLEYLVSIQQP